VLVSGNAGVFEQGIYCAKIPLPQPVFSPPPEVVSAPPPPAPAPAPPPAVSSPVPDVPAPAQPARPKRPRGGGSSRGHKPSSSGMPPSRVPASLPPLVVGKPGWMKEEEDITEEEPSQIFDYVSWPKNVVCLPDTCSIVALQLAPAENFFCCISFLHQPVTVADLQIPNVFDHEPRPTSWQ
jgi:hypothetical protein